MAEDPRYALGIDLGTTNCVVAAARLDGGNGSFPDILTVQLLQRLDEDRVGESRRLPSFLYYPTPGQASVLPEFGLDLGGWVVGTAAEVMGRRIQGRQIASTKSWLCHHRVGGESAILPWGGSEGVPKLSPLQATQMILEHLKYSWNKSPEGRLAPMENQPLTVTLPASFDQRARQLTSRACELAGLGHARLLEEPQAAFYNWISMRKGRWADALGNVRRILICDIGGGTSDFSLVECSLREGELEFKRVAVGRHLLLGGDNLDLAIANLAEGRMSYGHGRLGQSQWQLLAQLTKSAKEKMLQENGEEEVTIRLPGSGTMVIGGLRQARLTRDEVEKLVLEGFYPLVDESYQPRQPKSGLSEMGLPYESETAVTWHMLDFLKKNGALGANRPDAILFNGGSLEPPMVRRRIIEVLARNSTDGGAGLRVLESDSLADAVARGAAYHSYSQLRGGIKIGGGSSQAYYLGLGQGSQSRQICVLPKGAQAHEKISLKMKGLVVATNEPVSFPLYQSDRHPLDEAGIVRDHDGELLRVGSLNTLVRFGRMEAGTIPVSISGELTELDTLNMELQSLHTPHVWKLEFDLRGGISDTVESPFDKTSGESAEFMQPRWPGLEGFVVKCFSNASGGKGLWKSMEEEYNFQRSQLGIPALRKLADVLLTMPDLAKKSSAHEQMWLGACSYAMRPGFGDPGDELRRARLWSLFRAGPNMGRDARSLGEWAILWRRLAPGLEPGRQQDLFQRNKRDLLDKRGLPALRGEQAEMWRMLLSMEHQPPAEKARLGEALLAGLEDPGFKMHALALWGLGRLGSRLPLRAGPEYVLAPEVVEPWIRKLISRPDWLTHGLVQSLLEICRKCGDRHLDIDPVLGQETLQFLKNKVNMDGSDLAPLLSAQPRDVFEQNKIIGENLPAGLRLNI